MTGSAPPSRKLVVMSEEEAQHLRNMAGTDEGVIGSSLRSLAARFDSEDAITLQDAAALYRFEDGEPEAKGAYRKLRNAFKES